jgi:hypothetical protein
MEGQSRTMEDKIQSSRFPVQELKPLFPAYATGMLILWLQYKLFVSSLELYSVVTCLAAADKG